MTAAQPSPLTDYRRFVLSGHTFYLGDNVYIRVSPPLSFIDIWQIQNKNSSPHHLPAGSTPTPPSGVSAHRCRAIWPLMLLRPLRSVSPLPLSPRAAKPHHDCTPPPLHLLQPSALCPLLSPLLMTPSIHSFDDVIISPGRSRPALCLLHVSAVP